MKRTLKALTLIGATLFAGSTFAAKLVCDVYPKSGGQSFGNGTPHCNAIDFSFGNTTGGKYYLTGVNKPIKQVIWGGSANCSGGTQCSVTVRAYSNNNATALILYKDFTYESLSASMSYETGY